MCKITSTLILKVKVCHTVMSESLQSYGLQPAMPLLAWNSPGKSTGVGCHFSRGIFPTQGLNPGLLHCRQILYQLSHEGSLILLLL